MLYLKSVIAGIVALVIASVVLPTLVILFFSALTVRHRGGTAIGFDPVSIARSSPTVWLIGLIVFAAGFYWEYRRLVK